MPLFTASFPHTGEPPEVLPIQTRLGAHSGFGGRGVVIAFLDSGFYPHPDLRGRIIAHVDAVTRRVISGDKFFHDHEMSWHGQMTSVIACGDGCTSQGKYRGLAHGAQLLLIKVSNFHGHIKEHDILRGLLWLIENHRAYNVRLCSIPIGGDRPSADPDHPLHTAIRILYDENVLTICAAGNSGAAQLLPPASAPEALTVGGVDDRNTTDVTCWRPYHHNYGTAYNGAAKPEILTAARWIASPILPYSSMAREARWLAPLLRVRTLSEAEALLAAGCADLRLGNLPCALETEAQLAALQARIDKYKLIDAHHQHVDGTSVAAAIATSVVAQMLEANPRLRPGAIRAILRATAVPFPGVPEAVQGSGILNARTAVLAALAH
ncbi:MAG: S8 family serine peptidase [Chloroflexi bacterium]|jgi:serine protease AprX|nr:S8 family serine peptidase [Chloroflexota bacterium]